MEKVVGKKMPLEQQNQILVELVALKLPLLHQQLVNAYGEEKGKEMYEVLFEENFKRYLARFKDKDIGDIMMAEIDVFPATGWEIWVEKREENGEMAWFEHLGKCPHLEATRAHNMPDPCPLVCDMDCIMGEKYNVARWERLKHMPAGDSECCFKITRCSK